MKQAFPVNVKILLILKILILLYLSISYTFNIIQVMQEWSLFWDLYYLSLWILDIILLSISGYLLYKRSSYLSLIYLIYIISVFIWVFINHYSLFYTSIFLYYRPDFLIGLSLYAYAQYLKSIWYYVNTWNKQHNKIAYTYIGGWIYLLLLIWLTIGSIINNGLILLIALFGVWITAPFSILLSILTYFDIKKWYEKVPIYLIVWASLLLLIISILFSVTVINGLAQPGAWK